MFYGLVRRPLSEFLPLVEGRLGEEVVGICVFTTSPVGRIALEMSDTRSMEGHLVISSQDRAAGRQALMRRVPKVEIPEGRRATTSRPTKRRPCLNRVALERLAVSRIATTMLINPFVPIADARSVICLAVQIGAVINHGRRARAP